MNELELLRAECLRLRKERDDARNECESAALRGEMRAVTSIVAWLHAVAQQERERGYGLTADILDQHADAIERGEYEGSGDGRP